MIRVVCIECDSKYELDDSFKGRISACECGAVMIVGERDRQHRTRKEMEIDGSLQPKFEKEPSFLQRLIEWFKTH